MVTHLLALTPWYFTSRPAPKAPMPLGTILIADLRAGLPAVVEAGERLIEEPWYPLVLAAPSAFDHTTDALVRHYGLGDSVVVPSGSGALDAEVLVSKVRARPTPPAARLAAYVAARASRPDLYEILTDSFARGLSHGETAVSRSTLSRRLGGFGPLKPKDWSALAKVVAFLSVPRRTPPPTSDPRTIRGHVQTYTGMPVGEAQRFAGWEWIVETVLRRWGYLNAEHEFTLTAGERLG